MLHQRGLDCDVVRREAGLDDSFLDDPDLRVEASQAYRAWEIAVALTGEPDLGLVVAAVQPAGAFDLLEYAFRASPTLGRAFEQLARYRRVVRDDLEVALAEDDTKRWTGLTPRAFRSRPSPPA